MVEICGVYIGECIKFEYFSEQEMTKKCYNIKKNSFLVFIQIIFSTNEGPR